MQLRHVVTELGTGLRRNLSMHLSVVLTLFVSLLLAGVGILIQREADKSIDELGSQLQIRVNLCAVDDPSLKRGISNCSSGEVTAEQRKRIEAELEGA